MEHRPGHRGHGDSVQHGGTQTHTADICPHWGAPSLWDVTLTQLTRGSRTPRRAEAEATDGVAGHPVTTVTALAAALAEGARLTPWWGVGSVSPPVLHQAAGARRDSVEHSPSSQSWPWKPVGHRHWPLTGSQGAPCWHSQACLQPMPWKPGGQAGGGTLVRASKGSTQRDPLVSPGRAQDGNWEVGRSPLCPPPCTPSQLQHPVGPPEEEGTPYYATARLSWFAV